METMYSMVRDEADAETRYHMVRYLGDHVEGDDPTLRSTLATLLVKERSKRTRDYLVGRLKKARQ